MARDEYGLRTVSYDGDPDKVNSAVLQRQDDLYRKFYAPEEKKLLSLLDDYSSVDDAKENADDTFDRNTLSTDRNLRRAGMELTPSQQMLLERNQSLGKATNYAATVNDARLDNKERQITLRNNLINLGRGVQADGAASLGEAGIRAAARDASYDVAKQQHKSQQTQTYTTAAVYAAAYFL